MDASVHDKGGTAKLRKDYSPRPQNALPRPPVSAYRCPASCTSFEPSKRAADGRLVISFTSRSSVRPASVHSKWTHRSIVSGRVGPWKMGVSPHDEWGRRRRTRVERHNASSVRRCPASCHVSRLRNVQRTVERLRPSRPVLPSAAHRYMFIGHPDTRLSGTPIYAYRTPRYMLIGHTDIRLSDSPIHGKWSGRRRTRVERHDASPARFKFSVRQTCGKATHRARKTLCRVLPPRITASCQVSRPRNV